MAKLKYWPKTEAVFPATLTVTLAVGILSAFFGYNASPVILIMLVGIGGLFIFIYKPELGLATLLIAALNIPLAVGTGTQTSINAAILVLVYLFTLWIFDSLVLKRDFKILPSRPLIPLFCLCIAATIAFTIGQLDWFAFSPHAPLRSQLGGLSLFFFSAMAFILFAHLVKSLDGLEKLVWLFLLLAAGVILGDFTPLLSQIRSLYNHGALGSAFWVWAIALSLSQALLNHSLKLKWRVVLLGIAIAVFSSRFFLIRSWASGWLPVMVTALTILIIGRPWQGIPLAVATSAAGIVYLQSFFANLKSATFTSGDEYSYLTRVEAWQILGKIIQTNPITGFGPANYYYYTPLVVFRGYYLRFNSHNQYVDLIAQTGILGLLFFAWFVWEILCLGWRLKEQAPEGFGRAYAVGVLGGMAGTLASGMLGDWFIPFVYNIGFNGFQASILGWLFLGGLVALEQITKKQTNQEIGI